jgi:uncharacterized protein (TIRG00374 family)
LKKIWSKSKYFVFLFVGLFLLYVVFKDVDFQVMWNEMKAAHFGWIGISVFCGFIAMASRAYRWKLVLEPMGFKPRFANCFYGVAIGYFANIGLPRMGELVRCTILNQTDDIPVNKLFGTVIIERVIDVIILLMLIFLIVVTQFERFGSFFWNELFSARFESINKLSVKSGWILSAIIVFAVIALLLAGRFTWAYFKDKPAGVKLIAFLKGLGDGLIVIFKMKKKSLFLAHTLFIWFNYFLMTWVCVYAYDPISALKAMDGLVLMVVGGLGMSAPVQGGFGAFHYLVEKALLIYDIKPSVNPVTGIELRPGLVFATLVHTSQFLFTLFIGSLSLLLFTIQKRRNHARITA